MTTRVWNPRLLQSPNIATDYDVPANICYNYFFLVWCFSDRASQYRFISSTNFNAQFNNNMYVTLLSSTCFGPWHAHPQEEPLHKHSIWYPRSHKRLYTTPVESRLQSSSHLHTVRITGILNICCHITTMDDNTFLNILIIFNISNIDKKVNKELPEDDLIEDRNMLECFLKCFKWF